MFEPQLILIQGGADDKVLIGHQSYLAMPGSTHYSP